MRFSRYLAFVYVTLSMPTPGTTEIGNPNVNPQLPQPVGTSSPTPSPLAVPSQDVGNQDGAAKGNAVAKKGDAAKKGKGVAKKRDAAKKGKGKGGAKKGKGKAAGKQPGQQQQNQNQGQMTVSQTQQTIVSGTQTEISSSPTLSPDAPIVTQVPAPQVSALQEAIQSAQTIIQQSIQRGDTDPLQILEVLRNLSVALQNGGNQGQPGGQNQGQETQIATTVQPLPTETSPPTIEVM
jgi:hypothetical protein